MNIELWREMNENFRLIFFFIRNHMMAFCLKDIFISLICMLCFVM